MSLKESTAGVELLRAATRTADANGTGVDTWAKGRPREAIVLLTVADSPGGTSPTLDVKIQDSSDNSTWTDLAGGAFTQKTAGGFEEKAIKGFKRYIRVVHDTGGTTPSFVAAVLAVFGEPVDEPI